MDIPTTFVVITTSVVALGQGGIYGGPLVIDYRRNDGRTVPMNCEVEMHADAGGTITRAVWMLAPADSLGQGASPR
jgi:hypothetical protein